MHKAGHPSWYSGTTRKDGVGREVGGRFRIGGHVCTCGQLTLMHDKNHHNIAIILRLRENKMKTNKKNDTMNNRK